MNKLILLTFVFITTFSYAQNWDEISELVPALNLANQQFGKSVAIDGDYAVIAGNEIVFVAYYDGNTWSTQAQLTASDGAVNDYFGFSVDISGDNIVVGAFGDDDNGSNSGSAYVYTKSGTSWSNMTETAKLTASDGTAGDNLARTVSISGDNIVLGACQDDDNGAGSGSAYVYTKSGTFWSNMTETAKLTASDGAAGDCFGISVSISDENIVVGAIYSDFIGTDSGSAYIFTKSGPTWVNMTQTAKLTASDASASNYFGASVDISADNVVIGAPENLNKGAAYVFTKSGINWVDASETAKLLASDGAPNDNLGWSVSISDDNILATAIGDNSFQGSVYLYAKPGATWSNMNETIKRTASDANQNDYFGWSADISSNYFVVGAFQHDHVATDAGGAYLFKQCLDEDGDNYTTCMGDCDDTDPSINPGMVEIECNGIDDDCNLLTTDDATAPVADLVSLPAIISECSVTSLTAPTATDNCVGTITGTHNATLPITVQGTTVVTWTYDDGNGNTSTQTQNVVLDDMTAPIADNGSLPDVTAECSVASLTAPTATDNCVGSVTGTHNATLPITTQGATVVTWTYDDGNGNTSTQTQNVVIDDVTAPIADNGSLPDVTAECSVAILTAPAATDNCVGTITGTHNVSLPITTQGATVVTWTYDDGNGNTSTQTQNIVIDDVTAPIADNGSLPDVTAECSVAGLTAPTATDNCVGPVTGTHNATLPITTQGTTVVTWTYDDGNGNTSTQTQNVIIADVTAPVADIGMLSDINSECEVTPNAPTATDNCAGSITASPDVTFPITATGTTTITWTYDDGNGNTSTQTQDVIITPINVNTTTTASENDYTISADASGYTYQWIENCGSSNDVISGATSQSYTPTANGTYAVVIDNGTCSDTSDCVIIDDLGIDEDVQSFVKVYPNPTSGVVYIESSIELDSIELIDALGKAIEVYTTDNQMIEIKTAPGVYFLKINSDDQEITVCVLKQ